MEPTILTEKQVQAIQAQLMEAGYTNPEEILTTAHAVFAGLDQVERDGINLFVGEGENMFSILLFVDNGNGEYQHYSTRASWHWPSPILDSGLNIVVEEYHAEKEKIPGVLQITDELKLLVDQQNKADIAMTTEPLKSALEGLEIPGVTRLVRSSAWKSGVLFLDAVRDMRVPGTDTDIQLHLKILSQLADNDASPPFIVQVLVIPDQPKGLNSSGALKPSGRLRYLFTNGPIPDIGNIQLDVQALLASQRHGISQNDQKARQIAQKEHPPGTNPNKRNRQRH